jgi:hypothetical protein
MQKVNKNLRTPGLDFLSRDQQAQKSLRGQSGRDDLIFQMLEFLVV